ncbi:MAG: efflux RND transporter periplasmic adaptor subunit [Pseudomonadota bacterium]
MKYTRHLLATCLTACVMIGGTALAEKKSKATVVAYISQAQNFADTLVLRGRTEADRRVEIRSEIEGLVSSPPLRKGAEVKKGEILCQISEGDRQAELAEAEARLKEAELNYDAADQLSKKGFTSATTASARGAALEQTRAMVLRAQIALDQLSITAPFDGVLETDTAELGSFLQRGTVCASLIALDPIKMVAFAPERSVDRLQVGAPVTGRLITGATVSGSISFVARSADRDTRTYLIEAETPNSDMSIRDGMTVEMDVVLEGEAAHLLPQTALTLDNEGELGVRINEDGLARFIPVTILRDETQGVWVEGLPERAEVIVVGQEFIIDGQPLNVDYVDPSRIQ